MQRKKRKSAKRVKSGRRLARSLPRDKKGKFLPRGSKNLFRKKIKRGKKRGRSVPTRVKPKKKRKKRSKSMAGRRTRGKTITTDIFPNFLTGELDTVGAADPNTFRTTQVFTPIPRLKTLGNRATVMELLWVDIHTTAQWRAPDENLFTAFHIGAAPTKILPFNDPRVFAYEGVLIGGADVTATRGGLFFINTISRYQMQDNMGNGYLMASDAFHVSFQSTGITGGVVRIEWKLFYRFVEIPLADFVGLVQSTQQS